MRWRMLVLGLLALPCCGERVVSSSDASMDGPAIFDLASSADAPTATACAALAGIKDRVRVATFQFKGALFHPQLDYLLLIDAQGMLSRIDLPMGKPVLMYGGIGAVQWLGAPGGRVLASRATSPGGSSPYQLRVFNKGTTPGVSITTMNICGHLPSPDGKRVWVVRGCVGGNGTLDLLTLNTFPSYSKMAAVASQADAASLVVSPDSAWAAVVTQAKQDKDCFYRRGTALVVDAKGTAHMVAKSAVAHSLQFLKSGALLAGTASSCDKTQAYQLERRAPPGWSPLKVGPPLDYGSFGWMSKERYAVSPDEKAVLGSSQPMSAPTGKLYHMHLDGSYTRLAASDLYPFWSISAIFRAWAFAADGTAVYANLVNSGPPPAMGLTALTTGFSQPLAISKGFFSVFYDLSPVRGEVALVERSATGDQTLVVAVASSGKRTMIHGPTKSTIRDVAFVADGRGLLYVTVGQGASGSSQLWYAPRGKVGGGKVLGGWASSSYRSYLQDELGCAVIYNSDAPGTGGTYLAPIP